MIRIITIMTNILILLLLYVLKVSSKNNVTVVGNVPMVVGNVPMVFILGVQKGGSSSLYEFMIQHPLLCGGIHKEPHFFDHMNLTAYAPDSPQAREALTQQFPDVKKCKGNPEARYIDGSTMFGSRPVYIDNIYKFYNSEEREKLRFIVIIREPVSRDYSWYCQVVRDRLGREGIQFADLHTLDEINKRGLPDRYSHIHRRGDYVNQLKNFLRFFRRDQLLVLSSTAVFSNSSMIMDAISNFMNINKPSIWSGAFPHDDHLSSFGNIADCITKYTPKFSCEYKEELAKYYEPLNEEFFKLLKETKPLASKFEPEFVPFKSQWKTIKCVDNPREELNKVIVSSPKRACINIETRVIS